MDIHQQVREVRERLDMSQTDLAQKAGTQQSSIARLEAGTHDPSLSFLKKVAEALGCDLIVELS